MAIGYLKTKAEFLEDAPQIADLLWEGVRDQLGETKAKDGSEYRAWKESLQVMYWVLNDPALPDDIGVGLELKVEGSKKRADLVLTGLGVDGRSTVVIVELKNWSDPSLELARLSDHVVMQGKVHLHPSAQALEYETLLRDFYVVVSDGEVEVFSCAFLGNLENRELLETAADPETIESAPFFCKGENDEFRRFVAERIATGDSGAALEKIELSEITPSKQLADRLASQLGGNNDFKLIGNQKQAFKEVLASLEAATSGERVVVLVEGGPGTGKSVVAIKLLSEVISKNRWDARYVTKNAAPRAVFDARLHRDRSSQSIRHLFVSSDTFWSHGGDPYDLLIVDEAHRLVPRGARAGSGGENQVAEIIAASRISVFFVDDDQAVTWQDFGFADQVSTSASQAGASLVRIELDTQFRQLGGGDYLGWVNHVLGISPSEKVPGIASDYEVKIFDSPSEMRDAIFKKNSRSKHNDSRLLAGYCWEWESRSDTSVDDIAFPGTDFSMKWNLNHHGQAWMAEDDGYLQVGSVFTAQGLEGPFMGVIIGNDLMVREGQLQTDPNARARSDQTSFRGSSWRQKSDDPEVLAKLDQIIRNQYRVLLTRGTRGTFIFSEDQETREYFRQQLLEASRANPTK